MRRSSGGKGSGGALSGAKEVHALGGDPRLPDAAKKYVPTAPWKADGSSSTSAADDEIPPVDLSSILGIVMGMVGVMMKVSLGQEAASCMRAFLAGSRPTVIHLRVASRRARSLRLRCLLRCCCADVSPLCTLLFFGVPWLHCSKRFAAGLPCSCRHKRWPTCAALTATSNRSFAVSREHPTDPVSSSGQS